MGVCVGVRLSIRGDHVIQGFETALPVAATRLSGDNRLYDTNKNIHERATFFQTYCHYKNNPNFEHITEIK